jgi:hypothetical protein
MEKAVRKGHLSKLYYHHILVLSSQKIQYIVFDLGQHWTRNSVRGIGVLRSLLKGWTVNAKVSALRGFLLAYRTLICDLAALLSC